MSRFLLRRKSRHLPPRLIFDVRQKNPIHEMKLRFDDEELLVALPPEEFDKRIRELARNSEAQEISHICERIVYWRGEIPESPKTPNTVLWILGYAVASGIFLFGLYSLGVKLVSML